MDAASKQWARAALPLAWLALAGCNALLGIEQHGIAQGDGGACEGDACIEMRDDGLQDPDACVGACGAEDAGMEDAAAADDAGRGDGRVDEAPPIRDLCDPDPCADIPDGRCDPETGECVCGDCDQEGRTRCEGDGELSSCERQPNGCLEWTPPRTCADGCSESGMSCAGCSDQCESGDTLCDDDATRRCIADETGCLVWGPAEGCDDGIDCTNDACDSASGLCDYVEDDSRCTANAGQQCVEDVCDGALGCLAFDTSGACSDGDPCTYGDSCGDGLCTGTLDEAMPGCVDLCPSDPIKSAPGQCGCGVEERTGDADLDGTIDCSDACPNDECLDLGLTCRSGMLSSCVAGGDGCKTLESEGCGWRFTCQEDDPCPSVAFTGWAAGELVYPLGVAVAPDGDVFTVSWSFSNVDGQVGGNGDGGDVLLTRFTASGQRDWSALWNNGSREVGQQIAISPDGTRAAVGVYAGVQNVVLLWSTASRAAPLWTRDVSAPSTGSPTGIAYGPGGDIYVIGFVDQALTGFTNLGSRDVMLARVNASNGNIVWAQQLGSSGPDEIRAIATDASGIYVAGMLNQISTAYNEHGDGFVRKYDAAGAMQWHRDLDYGEEEGERIIGLTMTPTGNVLVFGNYDWVEPLFVELTPSNTLVRDPNDVNVWNVGGDGRGNYYGQEQLGGRLARVAGGTTQSWLLDATEASGTSLISVAVAASSSGPTSVYAVGGTYGQNENGFLATVIVP